MALASHIATYRHEYDPPRVKLSGRKNAMSAKWNSIEPGRTAMFVHLGRATLPVCRVYHSPLYINKGWQCEK